MSRNKTPLCRHAKGISTLKAGKSKSQNGTPDVLLCGRYLDAPVYDTGSEGDSIVSVVMFRVVDGCRGKAKEDDQSS